VVDGVSRKIQWEIRIRRGIRNRQNKKRRKVCHCSDVSIECDNGSILNKQCRKASKDLRKGTKDDCSFFVHKNCCKHLLLPSTIVCSEIVACIRGCLLKKNVQRNCCMHPLSRSINLSLPDAHFPLHQIMKTN